MPSVVAVVPQSSSRQIEELLAEVRSVAGARDWPIAVRRTRRVRLAGEGWERGAELLTPADAMGLYRRLHRSPTLVLAFAAAMVRRDPSRDPPVRRAAIGLEEFVAYKGVFGLIRGRDDTADVFARFSAWNSEVRCDGEADPRILPLQVFGLGPRQPDLATGEGTTAFREQHGPPAFRTDSDGVEWRRADRNAFHGGSSLLVAGCDLPAGLHWDVSRRGRSIRLANSSQVWRLKGNRAYVNVYPDSHIRPPKMAGVRQVWPQS
jgi:hypothetical protein